MNGGIMDYIILKAKSVQSLERKVKEKILEGYKPQGGVSIAYDSDEFDFILVQAMVK